MTHPCRASRSNSEPPPQTIDVTQRILIRPRMFADDPLGILPRMMRCDRNHDEYKPSSENRREKRKMGKESGENVILPLAALLFTLTLPFHREFFPMPISFCCNAPPPLHLWLSKNVLLTSLLLFLPLLRETTCSQVRTGTGMFPKKMGKKEWEEEEGNGGRGKEPTPPPFLSPSFSLAPKLLSFFGPFFPDATCCAVVLLWWGVVCPSARGNTRKTTRARWIRPRQPRSNPSNLS
ncbi:hypothetical protein M406DRAFT_103079 [Cryphonectria parasitica EP155]|uniref:Uncharacterized protein n=1 Tax=Cryphonectria parasitica (strain ATCC 38755 / EP155) TaxID=660469 RepID=A0A9P5CKI6_CRYP1|nr:uncharacterized protein M406DRAFT_103079 [Cryphonectria parasitica EP155]KAF3762289.1 hypothetical protein M406DRAFT_103079 [Cryphonectria parasitica EP155]